MEIIFFFLSCANTGTLFPTNLCVCVSMHLAYNEPITVKCHGLIKHVSDVIDKSDGRLNVDGYSLCKMASS